MIFVDYLWVSECCFGELGLVNRMGQIMIGQVRTGFKRPFEFKLFFFLALIFRTQMH